MKQFLFLVVCACAGQAQQPPVATRPVQRESIRGLTLLDAGAPPLQRIALELSLHVPQHVEKTLRTKAITHSTNGLQDVGVPRTITLRARIEATDRVADRTHIVVHVEDVSGLDGVVPKAQLDALVSAMKMIELSWEMTPSGEIANMIVSPKIEGLDDLGTALAGGTARLPESAIGVGARWRTTSEIHLLGQDWSNESTTEVRAITDEAITVRIDSVMRAHPRVISIEPTRTKRLTSGTYTTTEELVIPRHGLFSSYSTHSTGEVNVALTNNDKTTAISTSIETDSTAKSVP